MPSLWQIIYAMLLMLYEAGKLSPGIHFLLCNFFAEYVSPTGGGFVLSARPVIIQPKVSRSHHLPSLEFLQGWKTVSCVHINAQL